MNLKDLWNFKLQAAVPVPPTTPEEPNELVDQQQKLREFCDKKRQISRLYETLEQCNRRVGSRKQTTETCEQELFDYVQALDSCAAKMLFSQLV